MGSGTPQQDCQLPAVGTKVNYQYTVTNKGTSSVDITVTDDLLGAIAGPVTLAGGGSQTFTKTNVTINTTTTNIATVDGVNHLHSSLQCTDDDFTVVTTPCFLGDPATKQLYPYTTGPSATARTGVVFNESEVLRKFQPAVATVGGTIRVFYNDEHALLLGVRSITTTTPGPVTTTKTFPVTAFVATVPVPGTKVAASAVLPDTGATEAQGGTDPSNRPIFPALFCTDITGIHFQSTLGDWQQGGVGFGPEFVSGTWKSATKTINSTKSPTVTTITTDADPAKNNYVLGPGADPVPAGLTNQGYGTEIRWNVDDVQCIDQDDGILGPLKDGHVYRLQFMVHDGDQNKSGGDVGQGCSIVVMPPAP